MVHPAFVGSFARESRFRPPAASEYRWGHVSDDGDGDDGVQMNQFGSLSGSRWDVRFWQTLASWTNSWNDNDRDSGKGASEMIASTKQSNINKMNDNAP